VYDIADIYKFDTVVPVAFKIAKGNPQDLERKVRHECRDMFRKSKLLVKLIPAIEDILSAGEVEKPAAPEESVAPVIPNPENIGNAGHRS
jgi:CRISPR-associated protein Cas1